MPAVQTLLLSVRDLSIAFPTRRGTTVAVDGVSLTIKRGEILGLVGESGAGKSLTGMALIGLLQAPGRVVRGEIHLGDVRIDALDEDGKRALRGRRIGAIFQDPLTSLDPLFTIGNQLEETLRTHLPLTASEARARALALLQEVGIPAPEARLGQYPHQLSGGMRQRVVIALAIAGEPDLIIADEPTTALDVSVQAQITALLKRIAQTRGTGILLVTHDMGVIAETADRVAVMYAGRIVESGPVAEIIRRPHHPYTVGLMGSIPKLTRRRDRLQQIDGVMPSPGSLPTGCAFHPRCVGAKPRCVLERPVLVGSGAVELACWFPVEAGGDPGALLVSTIPDNINMLAREDNRQ